MIILSLYIGILPLMLKVPTNLYCRDGMGRGGGRGYTLAHHADRQTNKQADT